MVGAKGFEPSTPCSQKINLIYNHYKYLYIIYTLIQVHVARTNHATYTLAFLAYLLVFLVNSLAYLVYTLAFLAFFSWNISCIILALKTANQRSYKKNDPELICPGPSIDPRLLCRWLRRWYLPKLREVRQQGHSPLLLALQILIVDIGRHCYARMAQEL